MVPLAHVPEANTEENGNVRPPDYLEGYDRLDLFRLGLVHGTVVVVQWFERARFEDHGANGVLLGLLSSDLARAQGWR
jgi:hypothetical protein